jgi:hypothetical protein
VTKSFKRVKRIIQLILSLDRAFEAIEKDLSRLSRTSEINSREVANLDSAIRDRTTLGVDASIRPGEACQVVVIGTYKKNDYVRCFKISPKSIEDLIRNLDTIEKHEYAGRTYLDLPFNMKGVVESFRRKVKET